MTEPSPPPTPDDDADAPVDAPVDGRELGLPDDLDLAASATVDGAPLDATLDPTLDATLDPTLDSGLDPADLTARVELFSAIAARVAAPTELPSSTIVDGHIEAALATVDAGSPTTSTKAPDSSREVASPVAPAVVAIDDHRRRHRPNAARWLAVAAAVALVLLAIPVVRSLSSSTSTTNDVATSAASTDGQEQSPQPVAGSAQPLGASDPSAGPPTTASPSIDPGLQRSATSDLGAASSSDELTTLVQQAAPAAGFAPDPTSTAVSNDDSALPTSTTTVPLDTRSAPLCDAEIRAGRPDLGALRFSGSAVYQSVPVEVGVYEVLTSGQTSYRLIVAAISDCSIQLDRAYP